MRKVLIIASLVVMGLYGCGGGSTANNQAAATGESSEGATTTQREVSSQIAYIQLDSRMLGYDMYTDLSSAFETRAKQIEHDLTSRGRSLENAMKDAQNKFEKGLVTRAEGQQLQEDLARREQNFYQYRDTKQQELAEENQVMMNKIVYSIHDFIEEFNSDYRYGVILTTSGGSPVLHADPRLDITSIVQKGLNEKYAKEKNAKPAAE